MRILFVASEGLPFCKTGGLADVIEALPKALVAQGHDVAVVLPRYRNMPIKNVLIKSMTVPMGTALRFPAIADGGRQGGVQYFFVDDPEYFDRDQLYGVAGKDYPDNAERFAEFARASIELTKQLWMPEVIHCHDWQSALVPVLLRTSYQADPQLSGVPVIFTIHNMGYHGLFKRDVLARMGLPETLFTIDGLEFFGHVNFLKGGLIFADYLTTVSRKYAEEIQTTEYGHGLDGVVRTRADRLVGILNGVDYAVWNPEVDSLIAARYSAKDLSGKLACKKDLLAQFQLPEENLQRPLIGIVSRFADQKGFDLLAQISDLLMEEDLAIVALGAGEAEARADLSRIGQAVSEQAGGEDRLRQCVGAQNRSRGGHFPDALPLRALRVESDLQLALWYGACGESDRGPGRHDRAFRSAPRAEAPGSSSRNIRARLCWGR